MDVSRPPVTADGFDEIAAHCNRWADKSLAIARALIVDGEQLSDVAKRYGCSNKYANVVRARFYDKAQSVRLAAFKNQINPDTLAALKPYRDDLTKLAADGIALPQLVNYLAQQNVTATADDVANILKGAKA